MYVLLINSHLFFKFNYNLQFNLLYCIQFGCFIDLKCDLKFKSNGLVNII